MWYLLNLYQSINNFVDETTYSYKTSFQLGTIRIDTVQRNFSFQNLESQKIFGFFIPKPKHLNICCRLKCWWPNSFIFDLCCMLSIWQKNKQINHLFTGPDEGLVLSLVKNIWCQKPLSVIKLIHVKFKNLTVCPILLCLILSSAIIFLSGKRDQKSSQSLGVFLL